MKRFRRIWTFYDVVNVGHAGHGNDPAVVEHGNGHVFIEVGVAFGIASLERMRRLESVSGRAVTNPVLPFLFGLVH